MTDYANWGSASGTEEFHPQYNPLPVASTKEPTVQEQINTITGNPDMLKEFFGYVANKVVSASNLAVQVAELEGTIQSLRVELANMQQAHATERADHGDTRRELNDMKATLDQERNTVHQLVLERDNVRDALVMANDAAAAARRDVEFWQAEASRLERERNEATHAADVCREGREQMAGQVKALREAFGALRVIE